MKGFSGFGNSPAKQKYDLSKATVDGKHPQTEQNKKYEGMDKGELFLQGKTKDKDGNVKDIVWTPAPTPPKDSDNSLQKDIDKKYSKKSPTKQDKKVVGEQTGKIGTDKKGETFTIQQFDTQKGLSKGDTLFIPPAHHASIIDDEYLMGGDYEAKETKDSEKRKKGPKSYTLK